MWLLALVLWLAYTIITVCLLRNKIAKYLNNVWCGLKVVCFLISIAIKRRLCLLRTIQCNTGNITTILLCVSSENRYFYVAISKVIQSLQLQIITVQRRHTLQLRCSTFFYLPRGKSVNYRFENRNIVR